MSIVFGLATVKLVRARADRALVMSDERAPAPRHTLETPLLVERIPARDAPAHLLGFARNVSESGVFLQTPLAPPVGTSLRLRLRLPGGKLAVTAERARVVWIRDRASWREAAGMGVQLLGLAPEERHNWCEFCRMQAPS